MAKRSKFFPSAREDARAAEWIVKTPQTLSPAYRLAFNDNDFLVREELRPVRLQLELLKPELLLSERGIDGTIGIFGSARIPEPAAARGDLERAEAAAAAAPDDTAAAKAVRVARRRLDTSRYYDEARKLGVLISNANKNSQRFNCVVVTGGGPGIMEAANRGAHDAGMPSIGLNIVLPFEQKPNDYITPELCFNFHYFAIRKMHFLMRAKALVVFPGGFGTLDELFESLTLIQTHKVKPFPVLIFGKDFWERVIHFEALVEEGTISPEDLNLFHYVETAEEAWNHIAQQLGHRPEIVQQ